MSRIGTRQKRSPPVAGYMDPGAQRPPENIKLQAVGLQSKDKTRTKTDIVVKLKDLSWALCGPMDVTSEMAV